MDRLVITTKTKAISKKCFADNSDYMVFITNDDIVFSRCLVKYHSVKLMKVLTFSTTKRVYFYKRYPYPEHIKVGHYHGVLYPEDHFYWNVPKHLCPIYCYGLAMNCNSNAIDEIIRYYSKMEEEQKMLHFHATDATFYYQ